MTLELHIKAPTQDAFGHMLWSHPQITGDPDNQLEVQWLPDYIWVPYAKPCWHCGEPTCWIDLGFETNLCPGECSERKWDEYWWQSRISWLQGHEGQQWIFDNFGNPPRQG